MKNNILDYPITHKKYKTVEEVLNCGNNRVILSVCDKLPEGEIKSYIIKYVIDTKNMTGNLTNRIKGLKSKCIYNYIVNERFRLNTVPFQKNIVISEYATTLIHRIHRLNKSLCGTFMDYLIRRIIVEIKHDTFYDSRLNYCMDAFREVEKYTTNQRPITYDIIPDKNLWWFRTTNTEYGGIVKYTEKDRNENNKCGIIGFGDVFQCLEKTETYMKIIHHCMVAYVFELEYLEGLPYKHPIHNNSRSFCKSMRMRHVCCNYPVCRLDAYTKITNTSLYKTVDILPEIFVSSLSHTECFMGFENKLDMKTVGEIYSQISDHVFLKDFIEYVVLPLKTYFTGFVEAKTVLLNPALGGNYTYSLPSDCDLVVGKTLIDIKCTEHKNKGDEEYEILQLLGYSALLYENPRYNIHIDTISTINLLSGYISFIDCSHITREQYIEYLQILQTKPR